MKKTKICGKCKQEKLKEKEFYKNRTTKDGYHCYCKECQNKNNKKWNDKNKQYLKECSKKYNKQWREQNKEHVKEYRMKWREQNKEHVKEYRMKWKEKNKERDKEYRKKWWEKNKNKNKERKKEYDKKRYNKERVIKYQRDYRNNYLKGAWTTSTIYNHKSSGYDIKLTFEEVLTKAEKTLYCPLCDCELIYLNKNKVVKNSATLNQVDGKKFMDNSNTWIICMSCNIKKGKKTLKEYLKN